MRKTIFITGSSSGIGKATAKYFQQKGWNVVATMRTPDKEKELNKLDNVAVVRLDVTDHASIASAVKAGIHRFDRIDVLLNNAGFGAYGPIEATPIKTIKRQFDTNVLGVLETIKAVVPHFRANKQGVIVNMASMGGKIAFPLGTLYHGTKFAVEGLSEALSYEMAAIGVRVKLIEPGMINTDFAGRSFDFSNDEGMTEYQDIVQKLLTTTSKTQTTASEPIVVAEVIYRAATDGSDQLRYIAGKDAEAMLAKRESEDDKTFLKGVRSMFQL